jgi:hypothetical protein
MKLDKWQGRKRSSSKEREQALHMHYIYITQKNGIQMKEDGWEFARSVIGSEKQTSTFSGQTQRNNHANWHSEKVKERRLNKPSVFQRSCKDTNPETQRKAPELSGHRRCIFSDFSFVTWIGVKQVLYHLRVAVVRWFIRSSEKCNAVWWRNNQQNADPSFGLERGLPLLDPSSRIEITGQDRKG